VRTFLDHIARGELHALIHKQTEQKLENPSLRAALTFAMTNPAVAVHGLTKFSLFRFIDKELSP